MLALVHTWSKVTFELLDELTHLLDTRVSKSGNDHRMVFSLVWDAGTGDIAVANCLHLEDFIANSKFVKGRVDCYNKVKNSS